MDFNLTPSAPSAREGGGKGAKVAVCGKGGVGKSTIAAALALTLSRRGEEVLALDADPDANLASALGVPHALRASIVPIARQIALIEERTGATVDNYGKVFKLNPDVKDVAERFGYCHNGINLLVLGAIQQGGGGCACPASTFARALVTDLVLYKNQHLIMDMEAGVEHLGRATTQGVDVLVIVTEPGQRAVDCAQSVVKMASEIGIQRFLFVGNKIAGEEDEAFLKNALPGCEFAAMLSFSDSIRQADRDGVSVLDTPGTGLYEIAEEILAVI